jgi:hypothetical protein
MESRADATTGWWHQQYLLALAKDPQYWIRVLDRENRFNKFSRVFNRAVSSVTRLVMMQPGEAVSMVIDGARGGLANRDATVRERLMAFEARRFLELFPTSPDAGEVREMLGRLEVRLSEDRARWYWERGVDASARGQWVLAQEYLRLAPLDQRTSNALEKLAESAANREEAAARMVAAGGGEQARPLAYRQAVLSLARNLSGGSAPSGWNVPAAQAAGSAAGQYAAAAAQARAGDLEGAVDALTALARDHPRSPEAPSAEMAVASPGWNPQVRWELSATELDQRRKRYALTGNRGPTDTALAGASAAAQAGAGAAALFGTDIFFRSVAEGFRSRVDSDEAQDAAAAYLRRLPEGRLSAHLKRVRVDLEKLAGNPDAALDLIADPQTAPGSDRREVAKLRERQARDQLVQALQLSDLPARRGALERLARDLGDTPSGRKAAERLAGMPGGGAASASAIVVPRTILQNRPEAAAQLGVPADWVDGKRGNGELTAEGVVVAADGQSASMRTSSREGWRTQSLGKPGAQKRLALAQELALVAAEEEEGKSLLSRRRLPLGIEGGAGGSGVDVAPRLLPFEDRPGTERLFGR